MASADDYAEWIVKNADKKGTSDFDTVAKAYQIAKQSDAPAAPVAEDPGPFRAAMIAGGQGLDKMAAGLRAATPAPVRGAMDWANNAMGLGPLPSIDPAVQASNQAAMKPLQDRYPLTTGLAEAAPTMAGGPLAMAAMAGLSYGTPQEKMMNAGGAFIGGKAGELLGAGLSRVAQPIKDAGSEAMTSAKALFDKYGISALPSQITGSKPLGWLESTVANLPGGGSVRRAVAEQGQGLNRAALAAAGGEGSMVTPEAVNAARAATGRGIGDATSSETVAINKTVGDKLTAIENDYYKNLSPDQRSIVKTYIDDIRAYGESGMPGEVYQKARSRIAARASGTQDSELKNALTGVYKALDRAFDASAGADAAKSVQALRDQYRVAKAIEPLANVGGDISPARLASAAKRLPQSAQDLPQLAQSMKSLPDSGTGPRLAYQAILSGGIGAGTDIATGNHADAAKYGAASFAAPYLASKVLTSGAFQKYLQKGLLDLSPEAERMLIESLAGGGGLLGMQVGQRFGR